MSDLKTTWSASWAKLKLWSSATGLPVLPPLGALIELAVLVAAIVTVDAIFPQVGFSTLEPSPFWVPVLLLSLQYGTVAGLLAAAAATAAYVFNGVAEQAVGENFFAYLLRIWAMPILWIGVALVLGQFRLRQIASKQALRQALVTRTDEAHRLAIYSSDLEARCQRLERQMTARTAAPVKPVLDALAMIAAPAPDADSALDSITGKIWPGAQVSMCAVTPNGCEVIGRSGWGDTARWATSFASAHPLYRAIVTDRRPVSILKTGDETVLAGQGIAAHPILTADGARVIGMLKIETIDPALFDRQTTEHLSVMARLLGPLLSEPRAVSPDTRDLPGVARLSRSWKGGSAALPSGDVPPAKFSGVGRSVKPRRSS
ncbi:MAG: GAF domain-containing protein [Hyphomicrobium sp.]